MDYNKNVPLTYVISRLNEKLYTKNKKLRKKYVDMQGWESYLVGSLMMLCNEAWCEKQKDVPLSWQELKWLREN